MNALNHLLKWMNEQFADNVLADDKHNKLHACLLAETHLKTATKNLKVQDRYTFSISMAHCINLLILLKDLEVNEPYTDALIRKMVGIIDPQI